MKTKTEVSLVELLRGVPMFKRVVEILESKEFVNPDQAIPDGSRIVGLMSPLERACYSFLENEGDVVQRLEALGECSPDNRPDPTCLMLVDYSDCPFVEQIREINTDFKTRKIIRKLMFSLIESRLEKAGMDLNNLSLNKDFRITTTTKMDPPETIEVFEEWENWSVEEMFAKSLKDTFLAFVPELLNSKAFVDETTEISEEELFIREMTDLEKVLRTKINETFALGTAKSAELEKFLMKSNIFNMHGICISIGGGSSDVGAMFGVTDDTHPDAIKARTLNNEVHQLKNELELLNDLFWKIVESGTTELESKAYDITGIRKGFKVVMFND